MLDRFHLQWACSPLHDRDVNATGEPKRHTGTFSCPSVGKRATGKSGAFQRLLTARPQVCQDQKALIRYFSHQDNPEKAQYKSSDIEVQGGFDLEEYLKPTASECMAMQDEMVSGA